MKYRYMLITVIDREILTETFRTVEDARRCMHKEMILYGKVPKDIFATDSYDAGEYGFSDYGAWANDGENHANYDWLIVDTEGR